jgi:hypothetical protein
MQGDFRCRGAKGCERKTADLRGGSSRRGRNWVASCDRLGSSEGAVVAAARRPVDPAVQHPNGRPAGVVRSVPATPARRRPRSRTGSTKTSPSRTTTPTPCPRRLTWCGVKCFASCVSQLCTWARVRPRRYWGLEEPVRMTTRPPRSVVRVVMRTSDRELERRGRRRAVRARVIENCATSDDPVESRNSGREWRPTDFAPSSWRRGGEG